MSNGSRPISITILSKPIYVRLRQLRLFPDRSKGRRDNRLLAAVAFAADAARAARRASAVQPICFKKPLRKAAPTAGGIKKTRMAQRPLRKAAPTAGGVMRNGIEIPPQSLARALLTLGWTPPAGTQGSAMAPPACSDEDDDLSPIVVAWAPPPMTPPPAPPSPTYGYESCMTGYVTPINQPFEC